MWMCMLRPECPIRLRTQQIEHGNIFKRHAWGRHSSSSRFAMSERERWALAYLEEGLDNGLCASRDREGGEGERSVPFGVGGVDVGTVRSEALHHLDVACKSWRVHHDRMSIRERRSSS